jgi:phosphodiesterase/alkaline phosphatase D-like protein
MVLMKGRTGNVMRKGVLPVIFAAAFVLGASVATAQPNALPATSVTSSGFTANWDPVTGATQYHLDVSTDAGFGSFLPGYDSLVVTSTSEAVTGLSSNTTYYYRVRSFDGVTESGYSNVISQITKTDPPTAAAASTITASSFTANWGSVTGATGYELDVSTDNFATYVSGYNSLAVAGTSQSVTGLTAGTAYSYRVRAVNGAGSSDNSNSINTITIPAAPTATAATSVTATSFTANWGSVTGATNYLLDVSEDNGFGSFVGTYHDLSVTGTSQSVTGLSAGVTYYYRVRAQNGSGTGGYSNVITTATTFSAPVATAATAITATSFTANWGSVTGATGYRLDVSADNFATYVSGYNNLAVAGTSQSVTGLSAGTTYSYRVRAESGAVTSGNSNTITTTTIPATPTATAATSVTATSFTANWGSVTGATNYLLDVSEDNGFGSFVGTYHDLSVTGTSQSVTGLSAGHTYYYRVRAQNGSGTSGYSNTITTTTTFTAPVATAATAITATSFTANWGSVTGATGYRLDVATTNTFTAGTYVTGFQDLAVAGTSQSVTGLTAGTTYYYRVRAESGVVTSGNSNTITTTTIPAAPTATAATSVTAASFTANWGSVTGATGYRLDVSADGFSTFVTGFNNLAVGGTSQPVTGLAGGTTYSYRVRAENGSGASANSNVINQLTIPAAPTATAATSVTGTSFTANWGSVTGASGYRLDVSTDNGFGSFVSGYNDLAVAGTSQSVTGLTQGQTYYYRVRAQNASGTSTNSNTISLSTTVGTPTATAATSITTTSFTANWGTVAGATGYRLDVATTNTFTAGTYVTGFQDLAVAATSQSVTGLTAGTTYYYRVRAESGAGTSGNSNTITAVTIPAAPVATSATSVTASSCTANWGSVTGATGYRLDVSTASDFSSFVSGYNNLAVAGTSQSITGLGGGATYYYRVRAENASGASANSNTISQLLIPAAPTATAATSVTATSFTANWGSVTGATGYRLDVSTASDFSSFVSGYSNLAVAGTSQSVTGLTSGVTYYYRVRAEDATGTSANSNTISQQTTSSAPVATAATSITTTSFTANWGSVTGATGYRLDVSIDNNFGSFVSGYNNLAVPGTSQSVTGLTAGTTYYYRVRAESGAGTSGNSNVITAVTLPPAPTATAATSVQTNSFTANWNSVTGATGYRLDVSADGFSTFVTGFNNLAVAGTSQSVTGLSGGTTYSYRVRAENASGVSANSNVINQLTVPAAPTATAATSITSTSFTANWGSVTGAASYRLDVSTASDFSSFVSGYNNLTVAGTSQSVTGLTAGTPYYYRVRAVNATGTSANSNTINVTNAPAPPVLGAETNVTSTGFTINWTASTGATSYELDVSTSLGFGTYVSPYQALNVGNVVTYAITGLSPNLTYYYRLRAVGPGGTSLNSTVGSQLTAPMAPTASAATNVTSTGFTANWSLVAGATGYNLDVATDASFTSPVSGYNNLSVGAVLTYAVTGLASNTPYYYRVRATNAGGTSGNSNTINPTTAPAPPTTTAATNIASTSFTANWNASTGATGYRLDVSTDSLFGGGFVSGYNNLSVTGTSQSVTGLSGSTRYHYRVRAVNGSLVSDNSNTTSLTTLPNAPGIPTATAATSVTTTSFTANWTSVSGATGYQLDVATDNGFSSFVSGYNNLAVAGISQSVTGLSAGTPYYYRVRAVNPGGPSGNSNTITVTTIPPAPVASAATNVNTTSFTANWGSASGATGYRLDVATDAAFSSMVTGYNDLSVAGTSRSVTGLSSANTYYYRVRAENASGASANSNSISVMTLGSLSITTASPLPNGTAGTAYSQSLAATGGTAPYTWSVTSGALPVGYTLSSAGVISGTANTANPYNFTVKVVSANADSTTKAFALTVVPAVASKLKFVQQPTDANALVAISPAITVAVQDAFGNTVTTDTRNITLTIGVNPGGGAIGGTTTVPSASGVSTFSTITINKSGTGYKLAASSSPALTSDTSATFNITASAATKLAFGQQPTNGPAGSPLSPAVTVLIEDNSGNVVTTDTRQVTIAIGTNPSGGVLTGTPTVTASGGVATFSNLIIDKAGNGYTLTASSSPTLTGATSNQFNLTAGGAARLTIQTQPSPTATAGVVFPQQPVIRVEDANGNIVTTDTTTVVATASVGSLGGTTAVKAVNGIVTFTNLSYTTATTISITFTRTGLTQATSSSIVVNPATAAKVAFIQEPTATIYPDQPFTPAITTQLKDAFGNNVTTASTVTLTLTPTDSLVGGGPISVDGTGLATFANVRAYHVGTARLVASSSLGLTRDTSSTFTVLANPASKVTIQTQPSPTATAGITFTRQPVVRVEDNFGNLVTTPAYQIVASKGKGAGALTGTTTVTSASGVATYTNLAYTGADTTNISFHELNFSLGSATSTDIIVSPGTFSTFVVEAAGGGAIPAQTAGTPFNIQITAKDASGNTITSFNGTVNITSTGVLALGGGTTPAFTSGVLATYQVSFNNTGTFTITATRTSGGSQSGTSAPIVVNPGALTDFLIEASSGGNIPTQTAGVPFTIRITARDANHNTITSFTGPVTLTSPSGRLLGSPLVSGTFVSGVLASQSVRLDSAGPAQVITATSGSVSSSSNAFVVNHGAAHFVRVETAANGIGTLLSKQNVSSGTSITVYAIRRDSLNNFIDNAAATSWSLQIISGGVVAGDLQPSADRDSAVFTGAVIGKAIIRVSITGLVSVNSDTLTVVVAGTAKFIRVETAANGTGTVVPVQSVVSGTNLVVYAVARDAANNYVGNYLANWTLINRTGGISSSDIDPVAGSGVTVLKAAKVGTASIQADVTGLTPVPSGTITVVPGPPVRASAVAGTSGQAATVNSVFAKNLAVNIKDASDNNVPGISASFSAPSTGSSGDFEGSTTAVSDSNGNATAGAFRANTKAGTYADTARVSGVVDPVIFSLTNVGGTPISVTLDSAAAVQSARILTGFPHSLVVTVQDSFGNPSPSISVTYTAIPGPNGASGTFSGGGSTAVFTTNTLGQTSPSSFIANDVAGTYVVRVNVGSLASKYFSLTNTSGSVSGVFVLRGSGQSTLVGTAFDSALAVVVRDAANNPVANVLVRFLADSSSGGASGRFGGTKVVDSVLTDGQGIAQSSQFLANTKSGSYTVHAYASGIITPADFFLTNAPGSVANFLIERQSGGPIGTVFAQVPFDIRVTARDQYNNTSVDFQGHVDIESNDGGDLSKGRGPTRAFTQGVLNGLDSLGSGDGIEFRSAGTWTITATRVGGTENGTSEPIQVDNPKPAFGNITPNAAKRGQTIDIQINGSGFISGITHLDFGLNTSLQSTVVYSFNSLAASVHIDSNAATGPRTFRLTNDGPGGGTLVVQNQFTINLAIPSLSSLQPAFGLQGSSTVVVIRGSGFVPGATSVTFGNDIIVDSSRVQTVNQMTAWITINASAAFGSHPVIVTTSGGTSDSLSFTVTAPPPAPPLLLWPPDTARNIYTHQQFRWQKASGGVGYHFQLSLLPSFTGLVVDDSLLVDTLLVVDNMKNDTVYYWRVNARNPGGSGDYSVPYSFRTSAAYPLKFAVNASTAYPDLPSAASFREQDFRIVGLPGASTKLLAAYLVGARDKDWTAWWDNGDSVNYLKAYDGSADFLMSAGKAFWVLRKGMLTVVDSIPSVPLDSNGSVKVPLHSGWNLITNPFPVAVEWSFVQSLNGGFTDSLWSYNGGYAVSSTFAPNKGYYFDNRTDLDSLIVPFAGLPSTPKALGKQMVENNWRVGIALKWSDAVDRGVVFGTSPNATEGMDEVDHRKPRSFAGVPSVYFDRPSWDYSGLFASDIRPVVKDEEKWPFVVHSRSRERMQLLFDGVSAIPAGLQAFLVDENYARSMDLRQSSSYEFTPAKDQSEFAVVVGSPEAVQKELDAMLPKEFALGQNFPNPFNPTTTIPVSIPFTANVTLRIYNVLGEEIRTVHSGPLQSGRYWFTWDGRNDRGNPVATGVYLSRLTTSAGKSFTTKMILMK